MSFEKANKEGPVKKVHALLYLPPRGMRGVTATRCRRDQPIIGRLCGLRAGHNVVFPLGMDMMYLDAAGFPGATRSSGSCGELEGTKHRVVSVVSC